MTSWSLLACFLLVGLVSTTTAASLTLTLLTGSSNRSFVQIDFNGDDIAKLYLCMTSRDSLTCTADLDASGKHRNDSSHKTILEIDRTTIHGSPGAFSNVFTCSLDSRNQKLTCSRILQHDLACDTHGHLQIFQLLNISTKNPPCTGLQWKNIDEKLVYNSTENEFRTCDSPCSSTNSIDNNAKPQHASHPRNRDTETDRNDGKTNEPIHVDDGNHAHVNPHPDDESQEEYDNDHGDNNDDGRDNSHIIIAAVVSIVVTAGLVIAGFTFRRQVMTLRKDPSNPEGNDKQPCALNVSASDKQPCALNVSASDKQPCALNVSASDKQPCALNVSARAHNNKGLSAITISTSEDHADNIKDRTDPEPNSHILSGQCVDSVI